MLLPVHIINSSFSSDQGNERQGSYYYLTIKGSHLDLNLHLLISLLPDFTTGYILLGTRNLLGFVATFTGNTPVFSVSLDLPLPSSAEHLLLKLLIKPVSILAFGFKPSCAVCLADLVMFPETAEDSERSEDFVVSRSSGRLIISLKREGLLGRWTFSRDVLELTLVF